MIKEKHISTGGKHPWFCGTGDAPKPLVKSPLAEQPRTPPNWRAGALIRRVKGWLEEAQGIAELVVHEDLWKNCSVATSVGTTFSE